MPKLTHEFFAEALREAARLTGSPKNVVELAAYENERKIMVKWFEELTANKSWTSDLVRIAGLAVYGWMPTILRAEGRGDKRRDVDFEEVRKALNEKDAEGIDVQFLNGSTVGTSKFLHFWMPDHFAIWDSNIAEALGLSLSVRSYNDYQREIRAHAVLSGTTLREMEFQLFRLGQSKKAGKKKKPRSSQ